METSTTIAVGESIQGSLDLRRLAGCFNIATIKLDKFGGPAKALAIVVSARYLGLGVIVGCMNDRDLPAIVPGWIVGQLCDLVDLDCRYSWRGTERLEPPNPSGSY